MAQVLYVFIKPSLFLIIWIAKKIVNHFVKLYKWRDIQLTFLLKNTIITKFNLRKTPRVIKRKKTNQNTTRARIVIAGAGVVIAGTRIIITGARIIIAGILYVFWGKNHKNRFLLTLFFVFSGKIKNEEKKCGSCNPAWPVSAHPAKDPVPQRSVPWGPQICGPRKPRPNTILRQSFTG